MSGFSLHLLRHGAPVRPGLMLGHTNMAPLREGLAACMQQVSDLPIERLVTSDLDRCSQAAAAIGDAHGLNAEIDPRWRELDFGEWDGLAADAIDADALGRFWSDPEQHAPPGGESWSMLLDRVGRALGDLPPRPTLIVTHAGAMRAAIHLLCGIARPQLWAFDLPYACLLSFHIWPGQPQTVQIKALRG